MPPTRPKTTTPPTLRDLARLAGVSHTTVSLSLRNHPSIPEATRQRIRTIADRAGYRSNVLVSALMTQVRLQHHKTTAEVVGFLTGGPTADEWKSHSANVGFFEGARSRGPGLGIRVEPFWLGPGGATAAATCRMLRSRAIRGVLIAPFPSPVYAYELDWSRLCPVGLGYVYNDHALHRATHNHFRGAFVAYENLRRLGYRRIGLTLDRDQNRRVNFTWLGGYLAAQSTLGDKPREPLLLSAATRPAEVRAWLRTGSMDAVIGFGPTQYLALQGAGVQVPDDLAYAALDVEQMHLARVTDAAGINQNLPLVGATAVDILATQLYHNEQGLAEHPILSMIEGRWIDGATAPRA